MKNKKTRRSISVRGLTYQRLDRLAQRLYELGLIHTASKSGALEFLIGGKCDELDIPEETALRPRAATVHHKPKHPACFTF